MTSETTPAQSCAAGLVPAPTLSARERGHAVQQQAKLAAPQLACSGTVFVGMFFDGTGNNEELDYNNGKLPPEKQKPSNVVRLYHACKDAVRKSRLQDKSASSPHTTLASSYKNSPWRSTLRTTCRRLLVTGLAVGVLAGVAALSGCAEQTSSPGVTGYNHTTDRSIYTFSVNGSMGMPLGPQEGGGGTSCCVDIPRQWHPGIKVKVAWEYQNFRDIPAPQPETREAEVEVPQYGPHDIGRLAVHFFPDHKVKVLVTTKGINHPDYPAELRWDAPTPQ